MAAVVAPSPVPADTNATAFALRRGESDSPVIRRCVAAARVVAGLDCAALMGFPFLRTKTILAG